MSEAHGKSSCFLFCILNLTPLTTERKMRDMKRARELDRPNQTRNGWTTNWWYSCISQSSCTSVLKHIHVILFTYIEHTVRSRYMQHTVYSTCVYKWRFSMCSNGDWSRILTRICMCTRMIVMPLSGIGLCVYVYLFRFLSVYILFAAGDTMIKATE